MQKLKKALRLYHQHGSRLVLHRVLHHIVHERFGRQRALREFRSNPNRAMVRFLDQEFELHASGKGLSEEMALFGSHEPVATRSYLEHLQRGDHVLDVGANLGYYVLLAARAVGDSGRVLGFEPASDNYGILERNVARSGRTNIQIFPWAIGARNETTEFYESEVPNCGSLIQKNVDLPTRTVTVPVRKLDSLLDDFPGFHPNVLRMDVEGGELMVLDGAEQILRKFKPCLFIEFHAYALGLPKTSEAILKLRDMGYSSGTLIDRVWDCHWVSRRARECRCWVEPISNLLRRVESRKSRLDSYVFSMILNA